LIESYELEREPHVRWLVETATAIGERVAITDPERAAERDAEYLAYETPPVYNAQPIPGLDGGLLAGHADGPFAPGELTDQPRVCTAGGDALFDDVAGAGFVLVGFPGLAEHLSDDARGFLARSDCRVLELASDRSEPGCQLAVAPDIEWPVRHAHGVSLIRPDRYVYGSTSDLSRASGLVASLERDLATGFTRRPLAPKRETFRLLDE
jgi:hypothetical protein